MIEERIRVQIIDPPEGSLRKDEVVNLPTWLADRLMAEGKAKAIVVGPKETKVVEPVEVKVVPPEEKKNKPRTKR